MELVGKQHSQILVDPEIFRAELDIDRKFYPATVPAANRDSAIALLQIFTMINRPRTRGYVLWKGEELVAAVQAAEYIELITAGTSLKDPVPGAAAGSWRWSILGLFRRLFRALFRKKKPRLQFWDLVQVRPDGFMTDPNAKLFVLEMVIDDIVTKERVTAPNKESMIALLTAVTCEKMPRVAGWNLWDESGTLLASVPAVEFVAQLAEKTPIGKRPADQKAAGWRAMPVVTPTAEEFQNAIKQAKKEGNTPK